MTPGPLPMSTARADRVRERVRMLTGLTFPENRQETLRAGLAKGMKRVGVGDPETYLSRLANEPALLDDLVADITVGETYFFRDAAQCRLIRDRILPELLDDRAGRPLRFWSAGCATGEEAYTLSIFHAEAGAPEPAQIVGTDLSRPALARARRGCYRQWSFRGLATRDVARYFRRSGTDFALEPELMRGVDFRYLNLAEDAYPSLASGISAMDLILCRNVLIYFDGETAAQVIRRLMKSLAPGGWLLLGASDPLPTDAGLCEVVVTGAGLAYRRNGRTVRRSRPERATAAYPVLLVATRSRLSEPPTTHPQPPEPPLAYPQPDAPAAPSSRSDLQAYVAQVRSLANAGDLLAAGEVCAVALDVHRTSAELTYLHGVLLAEGGRVAEATTALRACLYLDRTLTVAHLALGGTLARLGDDEGARRALRNAERLLASQSPDAEVPASDGARAGRLAAAARAQLTLLAGDGP